MRPLGKRAGHKTLFYRTFRPVLAVSLLIIGLYAAAMQLNVLNVLKKNAVNAFGKQVEKRKLFVESEMNDRWSQVDASVEEVTEKIDALLEEKGAKASQIMQDGQLNQEILKMVMADVTGTLQTSSASEIFLVLDGSAYKGDNKAARAGIYLRNSNPESFSTSTGNLLFERGISPLSKEWQIPLDSFWKAEFEIQDNEDSDFYNKPVQAARENEGGNFQDYAYWSYGHPIDELDKGILMYSVPLITKDGTVIGVMGMGIREEFILQQMDYTDLGGNRSGAYLLVKEGENGELYPFVMNGTAYRNTDYVGQLISTGAVDKNGIFKMVSMDNQGTSLYGSVQKLGIYDGTSVFAGETWALLGIQKESVLLGDYHNSQKVLLLSAMIGVLASLAGVYWTSRKITVPVRRLVRELQESNPNRPIQLRRLEVEEIDVLSSSIEELSNRVAASFSKISTIIQMSESGISAFEYKDEENIVFLSKGFNEMMGWGLMTEENTFVDATAFVSHMKKMFDGALRSDLVEKTMEDGSAKWFRLIIKKDEASVLGVFTDVTADVLEKRQIEYERDYDVLTGLYNRRAFDERMKQAFASPEELRYGVFMVWDLDNLKYINDAYGHITGDEYIASFGRCLKNFEGNQFLAARRSGDEFVTFIYGRNYEKELYDEVQKIWEAIQSCTVKLPNGNTYKVRVSGGKSWYPRDAADHETLFQFADFAMYTVKHSRKGTIEDFNQEVYQENRILLQGQEAFNNLLEQHLVRYMLQPILSVKDGSVYGYEMLMRSQIPLFQSPLDILRMAHSQSRLYELEVMTWFEAMKSFVKLEEEGKLSPGSRIFINSIANQIMQPEMVELFQKVYESYLNRVICEFTEEEQNNAHLTDRKLEILRAWDSLVALDDYGCGYNSQSILLEIRPNLVKLDMSLVRGIDADENRRHLVKDLVLYARERGIMVLGEGVETPGEMDTLISLGVDFLQGYYLARPSFEGSPPAPQVCVEVREVYQKYWK